MGNKFGRKRHVVDDKYTRPQGLYLIKDVDYKKLRKLILESKLAPCYPGGDESDFGVLEECPICFLFYPTLNRSRCCMKSICTECFLQMKNPNSARPTQCPFCKGSNYAVEYRGGKSKEERGLEQVEEQKVIEAKIRMRQQELQEEEERLHKRQEISSSVGVTHAENIDYSTSRVVERDTLVSSQDSIATPSHRPSLNIQQNRDDTFDVDLEDLMVMEAIWLSIQENGGQNYPSYVSAAPEQYSPPMTEPLAGQSSSSSPSGGLACAIAALAERQQISGDQSGNYSGHTFVSDILPGSSSRRATRTKKTKGNYAAWRDSDDSNMERATTTSEVGDWGSIGHGSEVAEAGTSYASSDYSDDARGAILPQTLPPLPPQSLYGSSVAGYANGYASESGQGFSGLMMPPPPQPHPLPLPPTYVGDGSFQTIPGPIVPESFEEQMMLAMAVSLAEARAMTAAQGVAWH